MSENPVGSSLKKDLDAVPSKFVQDEFYSLAVAFTLYGSYTVIFAASTYILVGKVRKSRQIQVLFITTLIMYSVSTMHWVGTATFMRDNFMTRKTAIRFTTFEAVAFSFLPYINVTLGDAIVIWRAWLLWSRRKSILFAPGILLLCSIASAIVGVVSSTAPLRSAVTVHWTPVFCVFAALTNICSTALIGWKAWIYRNDIKQHLSNGNGKTQVEKLLILLVESGSIYSCITLLLASSVWASAELSSGIGQCIVQISGIYPTIIIVLAALQKTHCDRNFTYSKPLSFVAAPAQTSVQPSSTNNAVIDLRPTMSQVGDVGDRSSSAGVYYSTSKFDSPDCSTINETEIGMSGGHGHAKSSSMGTESV